MSPPRRLAKAAWSSFNPPCGSCAGEALALRSGSLDADTTPGALIPRPVRVDVWGSGVAKAPSEHVELGDTGDSAAPRSGDSLSAAAALFFRNSTAAGVAVGLSAASDSGVGGGSRTAL